MGGLSIWHWIIVGLYLATAVAAGKILKRLGFSPLWGIVALVPLFNLIGLWVVALIRWPLEDRSGSLEETFR